MQTNQTFAVHANSPTPIYPYGLQAAISVINTGTVPVYITQFAELSGGYKIDGGRSAEWAANRALYAYTETATGTLQISEAGTIGQNSVNIGGILTPVQIQGGGQFLAGGTEQVPFSSHVDILIPEPASKLAYPSLTLNIARTAATASEFYWEVFSLDENGAYTQICDGVLVTSGGAYHTQAALTGGFEQVTFPYVGQYPIRLRITNLAGGSGTQGIEWKMWGSSAPIAEPVTYLAPIFKQPRLQVSAGAGGDILIPPSHTPYVARARYVGDVNNGVSRYYEIGTPGFAVESAGWMEEPLMPSGRIFQYVHPGDGVPHLLAVAAGTSGTIFLSLKPAITGGS